MNLNIKQNMRFIFNKIKLKNLSPLLFFHRIIHQHAFCVKYNCENNKLNIYIIYFVRIYSHLKFQRFLLVIQTMAMRCITPQLDG